MSFINSSGGHQVPRAPSDKQLTSFNRSATLPAKVQQSAYLNSHNTGTLQSTDGVRFDSDKETPNAEKKIKKKGSFRIPSFSRKKKH
ncbi:unnamed protein product [Dicrocoelium dendriticum]|nr:unnamed protein product [Dicrocoelium dendriticum]